MNNKQFENLIEDLNCSICLEIFNQPRILPKWFQNKMKTNFHFFFF